MRGKIEALQILRGFAAMFVVIDHLWNDGILPKNIVHLGGFGVDIFFVLSGFIMCLTVNLNKKNTIENSINFLKKRIFRILPTYIICCIPFLLIDIYYNSFRNLYFYFGNLFLLPSFTEDPNYFYPLAPGWTLMYEMSYYYIFAFVLLFVRKKSDLIKYTSLFIVLMIFFINYFDIQGKSLNRVNFSYMIGDTLMLNFILGGIVYLIYRKARFELSIKYSLLAFILIVSCISFLLSLNLNIDRFWLFGLPAVVVVVIFVFTKVDIMNKFVKFFLILGNASFSLYLTHFFFAFIKNRIGFINNDLKDIILIIVSVIFAIQFYKRIELPISKFINKS